MTWRTAAKRITGIRLPDFSRRTLQRPFEIGLAGVALMGIPRMSTDIVADQPLLILAGLLCLVSSQILLVVQCLRPSRLVWPLTILAGLGLVLVVGGQLLDATQGAALWRVDAWLGVTFAFLAILHPRERQLPALAVTGMLCFAAVALAGGVDWRPQLLAMIFTAVPIALLALARLVVVALIDEGIAHRVAGEVNARLDGAARDTLEVSASLRRETHDSLLHCLQLIGASWSTLPASDIRAMCRRALRKLSERPPEVATPDATTLDEALRTAVSDEPCSLAWDVDAGTLPPEVARAIGGATREAVRNVMKHCPGARATVRARCGADITRVEIRDGGPGFDAAAYPRGRWGLRNSIAARMESVGGAASVVSGTRGTTVTLTWPAASPPTSHRIGREARAWMAWTPTPLLVGSLANVTATHAGLSAPAATLVWCVLAASVVLAALRVRTRGLTDWEAWCLCLLAVASIVANDLWIDPLTTNGWDLWVPSLTGCMIILALPGRRISVALAMAAVVLGGAVAGSLLILGAHASLVTHYGALMAVATPVLMTLVLAFGAASISGTVHRARQSEAALRRRARLAAEREEMWQRWFLRARHLTGHFLSEVASGHLDPTDQETRREACRLDARIRDELQLWPGDSRLAEVLDRMRREGWTCQLNAEDPDPATFARVTDLLGLLPSGGDGRVLTMSTADGACTLTFTGTALTADQLAGIGPWVVTVDPDFTQARIPFTSTRSATADLVPQGAGVSPHA
ncbi:MAG: hypothetical protein ABIS84_08065 [Arachnia sp.]